MVGDTIQINVQSALQSKVAIQEQNDGDWFRKENRRFKDNQQKAGWYIVWKIRETQKLGVFLRAIYECSVIMLPIVWRDFILQKIPAISRWVDGIAWRKRLILLFSQVRKEILASSFPFIDLEMLVDDLSSSVWRSTNVMVDLCHSGVWCWCLVPKASMYYLHSTLAILPSSLLSFSHA